MKLTHATVEGGDLPMTNCLASRIQKPTEWLLRIVMNQGKCQQLILALWIKTAIPTKGSPKRLAHVG
jgi:hypothetical protein